MLNVSIIGGSGYGGGELLRILLQHPEVEIKQVTSNRFAGHPVSTVHPNLRGYTNLTFSKVDDIESCDLLFIAIPNGQSMKHMSDWKQKAEKIVDLGADFRLSSADDWKQWYRHDHENPNLIAAFVYGIPELYREQIRDAQYVAGPGCEAMVSILTLYPLVKAGIIQPEPIIIDAKMSSSQAGNFPTESSHHAERRGVVRSYKPTGHRHTPEIESALSDGEMNPRVLISATAIEMVRGLLVTTHSFSKQPVKDVDLWKAYRAVYGKEPFVRVIKQKTGLYRYPEPKIIQGTNYCDVGFEIDSESNRIVAIGAIDNLVKGTAGNAVHCMNVMYGFEETTGLMFPGLHPI
jgi:N-acetyl-gamma-glutamyl-phosphate/LysW-gamma-L-alpha-aminoadipyl-6-phosphate reductase